MFMLNYATTGVLSNFAPNEAGSTLPRIVETRKRGSLKRLCKRSMHDACLAVGAAVVVVACLLAHDETNRILYQPEIKKAAKSVQLL